LSWPAYQYFPHPAGFLLAFALILAGLMLVLRLVLVDYAFVRLGLSRRAAILLLWASLLGSSINIPVARLPAHLVEQPATVNWFGMTYVVPRPVERGGTVVAINAGGALIPLALSVYLAARFGLSLAMLVALVVVTIVVHLVARPVAGVGITTPPLLAAVLSAGLAILLNRQTAPRAAFVAGTMGTLIGADLLNLGKLNTMGAPIVSIGGAGTFDGVFVTGVAAVLLAGLARSRGTQP